LFKNLNENMQQVTCLLYIFYENYTRLYYCSIIPVQRNLLSLRSFFFESCGVRQLNFYLAGSKIKSIDNFVAIIRNRWIVRSLAHDELIFLIYYQQTYYVVTQAFLSYHITAYSSTWIFTHKCVWAKVNLLNILQVLDFHLTFS